MIGESGSRRAFCGPAASDDCGKTTRATVDDRGRLSHPKDVREEYGERYRVIRLDDGVKLVTISEDPVEGLKEPLGGLADVPMEELGEVTDRRGREEARDGLR